MDLSALNIITASREHLALLRDVHLCNKDLYNSGSDLNQAITVYLSDWLPSLNQGAAETPALDVAWVWHLHKTDPIAYETDCYRWYGRILDAPHGMSPFCHSSLHSKSTTHQHFEPEFMERIASSARNQSSFLWHVRWIEYDDTSFLEDAVMRYENMITLMKQHPKQFIVPTYDIDLIWHTHLAFPSHYVEYCMRKTGRKVHHNDSVGHDRSPDSFLSVNTAKTEQLWLNTFGTSYRKKGAMYRGEPPAWYWDDRRRAASLAPASMARHFERSALANFTSFAVSIVGRAFGTANNDAEVHNCVCVHVMDAQSTSLY